MQHHIALLTLRLEVGQTVPCLQVFRTGDTSRCRSGTEVAWLRVVVPLGTEHAINPAILMLCDTHVIDIRGGNHIVGHRDRLFPEAEVVDAIRTLCHGKETLSVGSLHTDDEQILAIPFDGP